MNVRLYLNDLKKEYNIKNDDELAKKLGSTKTALDKWIVRNKIPDRILKELMEENKSLNIIKITEISSILKSTDFSVLKKGQVILDKFFIDNSDEKIYILKIDNDCMSPLLNSNDWVICNNKEIFDGDGLYVVKWDRSLMVKQLCASLSNDMIEIISINQNYPKIEVNLNNEKEPFSIFGKVRRKIC